MKEHPLSESDPIAAVAAEIEAGGDPVALVRPGHQPVILVSARDWQRFTDLTRYRRPVGPPFLVAMRGYDIHQVDTVMSRAAQAVTSDDESLRLAARRALRSTDFTVKLRGYSRPQVDQAIEQYLEQLS